MMKPITIRLEDVDHDLLRAYAKYHGMNVSEYVRSLIFEDISRSYDNLMASIKNKT